MHTPGPWTVHGDGTVVAGLYPIARTFGGREASDYNARLIAAAPEMAELIEEFLADQGTLSPPHSNEALCEKAEALLAEAKGE